MQHNSLAALHLGHTPIHQMSHALICYTSAVAAAMVRLFPAADAAATLHQHTALAVTPGRALPVHDTPDAEQGLLPDQTLSPQNRCRMPAGTGTPS